MNRVFRVAFLVVATTALTSIGRAQEKEITPAEFRKAVPVFMDDPASEKGKAAGKAIVVFTTQSKDVVVAIGKEETKWFGAKKDDKDPKPTYYLVAYMAGSALAQLDNKKTEHDTYAGLLQVFNLYEKFKKQDKDYKNPELDSSWPKRRTESSRHTWRT